MDSSCKAKKFQGRMSHRSSGKAMGEKKIKSSHSGKTMVEMKIGNMTKPLTASEYPHKQSKDGNGGK